MKKVIKMKPRILKYKSLKPFLKINHMVKKNITTTRMKIIRIKKIKMKNKRNLMSKLIMKEEKYCHKTYWSKNSPLINKLKKKLKNKKNKIKKIKKNQIMMKSKLKKKIKLKKNLSKFHKQLNLIKIINKRPKSQMKHQMTKKLKIMNKSKKNSMLLNRRR